MAYDPTRPADIDLIKKSAELIRTNFEGLRKDGIVVAKPPLYGAGGPAVALGDTGEKYIDTATGNQYLKNSMGQWELNLSLDDKYKTIKEVAVLEAAIASIEESLQRIELAVKNYNSYVVGEYKLLSHYELSDGWVKSDGGLYSPQKYPKAFAIYGIKHGGDGINTFAVPDWRGDAIRINDDSRGVDLGRVLGSEQEDEIKSHNHYSDSRFNKLMSRASDVTELGTVSGADKNSATSEHGVAWMTEAHWDASIIKDTGGTETRMRNRSCCMYVYIGRPGIDA